ncbi:phage baseplate protein [Acinetobacter sp. XH1741]|uniref:phage baseplate protein n=1 Tax=unclassified Acinetobacter TaxID=196816 RepID=UPI0032B41DEE
MAITETVGSLLFGGHRSIMGLFADVVIEENHTDELVITEHPVEKGSPISDHYYKVPPEVTMKIGWSESAGKLNSLIGNSFIGADLSLLGIYQGLQAMQGQRLIISTGKRLYTDMLIKSLKVVTDLTSENSLMVDVVFKKVVITSTKETLVSIADQNNPEITSDVIDSGTKQPKQVEQSMLSQITGLGQVGGAYTVGL